MMHKKVFIFSILGLICLQGYAQPDTLKDRLNRAPDTLKASILTDIAAFYKTGQPDSSIFYAQKAVETALKTKQDYPMMEAEMILSDVMIQKGEYVRATVYRKNTLNTALRIRDWNIAAQSYYALAQIWLLRNNYAEAIDNLKKGLKIARERDNLELLKNYYEALIQAYRKLYRGNDIGEYYRSLMEVDKQIDEAAYNNRIAEIRQEYETRIAELENRSDRQTNDMKFPPITGIVIIWAILATILFAVSVIFYRYHITAITLKNEKKLKDANLKMDVLTRDQSALFRFLTQYAYTGIDILRERIEQFTNGPDADIFPAVNGVLYQINNEIFALYGFFQNFLLLLQVQSGQLKPELVTVSIPQLATNLLADYEAFAAANDILLVNDVQNNVFVLADERLIDVVLRNLMSNAFKYVSGEGLITVGAKENYTDMEIWVTDDGIGLTAGQAEKLFEMSENLSLPGNPDAKGYGLGLSVCKALVEACNGRIWAETKPGEGFCIRFSLPKAENREMKVQS
jgi:signal transduction histidine kinase